MNSKDWARDARNQLENIRKGRLSPSDALTVCASLAEGLLALDARVKELEKRLKAVDGKTTDAVARQKIVTKPDQRLLLPKMRD